MIIPRTLLSLMNRRYEQLEDRRLLSGAPTWQYLHQDLTWIQDAADAGDRFGDSLALGDFDGDGCQDLAIGVPGEGDSGAVSVLYGSQDSVDLRRDQLLGIRQIAGRFNTGREISLAAADFDGDGVDDLAVGVPGAMVSNQLSAGKVVVMYGSQGEELSTTRLQSWHQNVDGVSDEADAFDRFGETLATGDFNDDGFADLAVGIPHETVASQLHAGAVQVIYGGANRLSSDGSQFWHQGVEAQRERIHGNPEESDFFGAALAVGDFNGDHNADLAIGVPGERVRGLTQAGAVAVLYGHSSNDLTARGNQLWTLESAGFESRSQPGDMFGFAVAAADFDADQYDDLAVGIPGMDVGSAIDAGAVQLLGGGWRGLWQGGVVLNQDTEQLEKAESNDRFGSVLAAADVQRENAGFELLVGVPGEDLAEVDVGVVHIIGTNANSRWQIPNAQTIRPSNLNLAEHAGEQFGFSLAAGDFLKPSDQEGWVPSIFIGIPGDIPTDATGGAVAGIHSVFDNTPPEVIVYPTPGQWSGADLVCFEVEFNEPVVDFDYENLLAIHGMTGLETKRLLTPEGAPRNPLFSGTLLTVGVLGMSTSGKIFAEVPPGAAVDAAGNGNSAGVSKPFDYVFKLDATFQRLDGDAEGEVRILTTFNHPVIKFTADEVSVAGRFPPKHVRVVSTETPTSYLVSLSGFTTDSHLQLTVEPEVSGELLRPLPFQYNFDYRLPEPGVMIRERRQQDPWNRRLYFDIQFSRPVFGFEAADIEISGTADADSVAISKEGSTYVAEVSGMQRDGKVVLSIPPNAAVDAEGTPNSASTPYEATYISELVQTDVYQVNSPNSTEESAVFEIEFSEPITGLTQMDLAFEPNRPEHIELTGSGSSYRVEVAGFEMAPFRVTVAASSVHPRNYPSQFLGVRPPTVANDRPERLAGDADGDGEVGFGDFLLLSSNYGRRIDAVFDEGDFNDDGQVGFLDYLILSSNFGRQVVQ